MEAVVVDCRSGEAFRRTFTQDEQDELAAAADTFAQERAAADLREQRRQAAIARLETFWRDRDSLTAGQVRTEAAFTARVLAKVLPYIDLDPAE